MTTLLLLSSLVGAANAGEFMDVWVTTAIEDTNVRTGPEEYSPTPNFVMRGNRTFFENYEARWNDDITQGHLVLYRKDDGFRAGWTTEAAMVLQFTPYLDPDDTDDGVNIMDDGSYVRVIRQIGDDEDHTVSLTGYAVDASRFRLGYSWDLSYGGREILARSVGAMPGLRLQWQNGRAYGFLGAKTAISSRTEADWEGDRNSAYYSVLAGGGVPLGEMMRLEFGAGLFQQGQLENVPDASSPLYGEIITARGLSAQLSGRTTEKLDFIQSSELRLYRNSPDFVRDSYISHNQVDGFGVLFQAEINQLVHNLLDADDTGATTLEYAWAGDLQTVLVYGTTEVNIDLVYKDLPYILFNIPGLTSGVSLPDDMEITPQLYGRFTGSHYFPEARVAPSIGIGVMQPATYTTTTGTYVQYTERDKEGVPAGADAQNIYSAILGCQLDLSRSMVTVGELLYTRDHNLSEVVSDENGDLIRVPEAAEVQDALGFNLMLRARF